MSMKPEIPSNAAGGVTMEPILTLNQRLGTSPSDDGRCRREVPAEKSERHDAQSEVLLSTVYTQPLSSSTDDETYCHSPRSRWFLLFTKRFAYVALLLLLLYFCAAADVVNCALDCNAAASSSSSSRTKRQAIATNAVETKTIINSELLPPTAAADQQQQTPSSTDKLTGRLNLGVGRYQQQQQQPENTQLRQNWLRNRAMTRPQIPYSPNYNGNNNNNGGGGVNAYPTFNNQMQYNNNGRYGGNNMDGGGGNGFPSPPGGLGGELAPPPAAHGLGGNAGNNAFATLQMAQQTNQQNLASIPVNQDYETPIDQSRRYSPIQNPSSGGPEMGGGVLAGRQGFGGSPAGIVAASQVNPNNGAQQRNRAGTNVIGNYYQAPQNLESIEEQAKRKKARAALEALCKAPDAEPKCRKTVYDMCMHDDLYPIDAAEEVLSEAYNQVRRMHVTKEYTDSDLYDTGNSAKHNRFVDFVHDMFTDGEYDNLPGIPERRTRICKASSMFFQPGWAKTLDGRWVVVFNSHRIKQHLRAELCEADGEKCNHVPKCYHSVCKQRYRPELLVTFDPCNTLADPVMETFYIPDGCECFTDREDDEVPTTTTTQAPPTSANSASTKGLSAKELKAKQKEAEERKHFNNANKFQNKTPPTQKRRVKEEHTSNSHRSKQQKASHKQQQQKLHSRKQNFEDVIRSTTTTSTPSTTTTTTSTTPSPPYKNIVVVTSNKSAAPIVSVASSGKREQQKRRRPPPQQVTVSLSDGASDDSGFGEEEEADNNNNNASSSESLAEVDIHKIAQPAADFSRRTLRPHPNNNNRATTIEVDVADPADNNALQERRKTSTSNKEQNREQQIINQLGGLFDLATNERRSGIDGASSAQTKNQRRSASGMLAEAAERSFNADSNYPIIGGGIARERASGETAKAVKPQPSHGLAAL